MPNIVFLMSDDHGWHETGYNGHPIVKTPVLDEMATTGLCLDSFYSGAPLCSPTRASVMTGRHPNRCGTFDPGWSIRPEEITIAQILSRAGYACGHFGKWHLGPVKADSPTNPRAMGFEEYLSHDNFFDMDPHLSHNGGPPELYKGESSEIVVDAANRFISKARAAGRPFFVVAWFGSPHEPYSALDADLAAYSNLPDGLQQETAQITSLQTGHQVQVRLDKVLKARYAEITAMDRAIGKLRTHLSREEVRDETLVWYCGDNGAPRESRFASPMRGYKGLVYEGGIRVPAVAEWPGRFKEPKRLSMDSVTSDILPTLCELTGQSLPERPLDGISLLPALRGEMDERPDPICFWSFGGEVADDAEPYIDPELQAGTCPLAKLMDGKFTRDFENYHHPVIGDADFKGPRAILGRRFKLVIDGQPGSGRELFDIRADAGESRDLASIHPLEAQRLGDKLKQWQQSVLESLTGADYV
jgi:arylsulfatase A-like enzyme